LIERLLNAAYRVWKPSFHGNGVDLHGQQDRRGEGKLFLFDLINSFSRQL